VRRGLRHGREKGNNSNKGPNDSGRLHLTTPGARQADQSSLYISKFVLIIFVCRMS
jgi:hypothetical protein